MPQDPDHAAYPEVPLSSLNRYSYLPLTEPRQCIRLLRLLPGMQDQQIVCELVEHDFLSGKDVAYDAVSWCWGTELDKHGISIRHEGVLYSFSVRANLVAALNTFRQADSEQLLWVDALSINQADFQEKSVQIPMMSSIYRRACKVRIWLGVGDSDSKTAIQFLKTDLLSLGPLQLSIFQSAESANKWRSLSSFLQRKWFMRRWVLQEVLFANAVEAHCGPDSITWQDLTDALSLLVLVDDSTAGLSDIVSDDERFGVVPKFVHRAPNLAACLMAKTCQKLLRVSPSGHKVLLYSLEELVEECQTFANSDPRDTIYGLISLANDVADAHEQAPPVDSQEDQEQAHKAPTLLQRREASSQGKLEYPVNYDQSYASHCRDYILFVIRQNAQQQAHRALDILCRPWAAKPTRLGQGYKVVPSWVCPISNAAFGMFNWPGSSELYRRRKGADALVGPSILTPSTKALYYTASGGRGVDLSTLRFEEHSEYHSLYLSGFVLDHVARAEMRSRLGHIPLYWAVGDTLSSDNKAAIEEIISTDDFWRTLVADRGPNGGAMPTYYARVAKEILRQNFSAPSFSISMNQYIDSSKNILVAEFCRRVQAVIWNRSLIRTTTARLGLAQQQAREGDLVCILYGCSVPVILRKHEQKSQSGRDATRTGVGQQTNAGDNAASTFYELIGECYVHGMMDGEALDFQALHGIPSTTFEIR